LHGTAIQSWSEGERTRSFESFAHNVDIVPPDYDQLATAGCDYLVFPNIDHSLLGTGIVKAVREHRARGLATQARVLPARAKVFALGIEWAYPGSYRLEPMNQFRWSLYPQPLELPADCWRAVTEARLVGEIDFENFVTATWHTPLSVEATGRIDAIVYWFDLDLGAARISNAPGSELLCIKPAVQYVDAIDVEQGQSLPLTVGLQETRLDFQAGQPRRQVREQLLPSWYVPMLVDRARNEAYRSALDRALRTTQGQTVLDIGAGCGLLSMMAAQSGAARVVGCEVSAAIANAATNVVRLNGLDDKITLINKDCRSLKVPDDVPARADLAVFELFDCSLIGEGVLHFLTHAREHLLKENARYLPRAARIRAMVVEYRLDQVWNLDVNLLNPYRFSPGFMNVDAGKLNYRPLTEPMDVFCFDFSTAIATSAMKELPSGALQSGTAGAVLFWFDLQLDETQWISNAPGNGSQLHWKQGLQFLPEVRVERDMQLPLVAAHDGSGLTFRWQQDKLPQEALSRLPRFDPRAMALAVELEQQTRGLLQYCARNPDEYTKVAELAKRFALDPGAHDLDPVIAQRFAATFFRA
jgi:type III protein arginine methyltransferase